MPTKFGRYDVVKKLGQGGMGAVYMARNRTSGRTTALRVMTYGHGLSPQRRERFVREAQAMAKLRHRNIVSIHEVSEASGVPYIAMDYVDGRSLTEALKEGIPSQERALVWMTKIVSAVAHAHRRGIIHRDLKPSNVLIDEEGEPMVVDFGLAKDLLSELRLTTTGQIIGTPHYMSPEQVRGSRLDARSDVFALGGILYALLTGHPPFSGDTTAVVMGKVLRDDPEPPSQLNPEVNRDLETICLKAMRKDPEGRYQTAEAMLEDLNAFLTGLRIKAKPETRGPRLLRGLGRRKARTAAVLLCTAIVIVASTAVLLWRRPESMPSPAPPIPGVESGTAPAGDRPLGTTLVLDAGQALAYSAGESLPPSDDQEGKEGALAPTSTPSEEVPPATSASHAVASLPQGIRDADRLLAACSFEEALAAYEAAGAERARHDMAQRMVDLRSKAASSVGEGNWISFTMPSGGRTMLCAMDQTSAVLADGTGTVTSIKWESLQPADVYAIYGACLPDATAADHFDLGLLCLAIGLPNDGSKEFSEAIILDPAMKAEVDRYQALRLAR